MKEGLALLCVEALIARFADVPLVDTVARLARKRKRWGRRLTTDVAEHIARVVQHPNRGLLDAPRLGLLCILPSFTSLRFSPALSRSDLVLTAPLWPCGLRVVNAAGVEWIDELLSGLAKSPAAATIEKLDLSRCPITDQSLLLLSIVATYSVVPETQLDLTDCCMLSARGMRNLVSSCSFLESLDAPHTPFLDYLLPGTSDASLGTQSSGSSGDTVLSPSSSGNRLILRMPQHQCTNRRLVSREREDLVRFTRLRLPANYGSSASKLRLGLRLMTQIAPRLHSFPLDLYPCLSDQDGDQLESKALALLKDLVVLSTTTPTATDPATGFDFSHLTGFSVSPAAGTTEEIRFLLGRMLRLTELDYVAGTHRPDEPRLTAPRLADDLQGLSAARLRQLRLHAVDLPAEPVWLMRGSTLRELALTECLLPAVALQQLPQLRIKILALHRVHITTTTAVATNDEPAQALEKAIQATTSLRTLELVMVKLSSAAGRETRAPVTIRHDRLTTLWLRLNPHDTDSLELAGLRCRRLVELVVLQQPWGRLGVDALVRGTPLLQRARLPDAVLSTSDLVAMRRGWPHLSTISAAQWEADDQLLSTAELRACFAFSRLESLSLGPSLGVTDAMLQAIVGWSPHLRELVMDGLVAVTTLEGLKSTSLRSLDLAGFTGLKGRATLKGLPKLEHLALSYHNLSEVVLQYMQELATVRFDCSANLTTLVVEHNPRLRELVIICTEQPPAALRRLSVDAPRLTSLSLEGFHLDCRSHVDHLRLASLQQLFLYGRTQWGETDSDALVTLIKHFSSLWMLKVANRVNDSRDLAQRILAHRPDLTIYFGDELVSPSAQG
ncbi:uncharacterized protein ACA1_075220 [Acanthamoeba castellanii str. Neff]|uniref:Leucine rich repeat domain containing protein n=1 Tax=Acanthamoeba castellanii (strain ATCC 30010 / Neff) TaxID=1257118 RepID=L8HGV9_ACACF|nr:uncharacterized protein ACA1_075220 [Acanthamoeba castellanii str. Neff]ELR23943.1 hypothetical protein ACA1_075220 [Acanthamoeba castellanii str. Neff]